MKRATTFALALGLALFAGLILYFGAGEIARAAVAAGWGLLWVSLYRFLSIAAHGMGWRALFPANHRPRVLPLLRMRWVGEAINSMLPVAQVGGDFARGQLAARSGVPGAIAGASVLADFTVGLGAQVVFTGMGVAVLAGMQISSGNMRAWLAGVTFAAGAIVALYWSQRSGWMGRLAHRFVASRGGTWATIAGGVAALERETDTIYRQPRMVAACFVWRLLGWFVQAGETWLALNVLGVQTDVANAVILEGLSSAVRSAAFAIPGAVGVQEGGFVLVGTMLGLSPETSLALALVKRVRELAVGIPGLAAWLPSKT